MYTSYERERVDTIIYIMDDFYNTFYASEIHFVIILSNASVYIHMCNWICHSIGMLYRLWLWCGTKLNINFDVSSKEAPDSLSYAS